MAAQSTQGPAPQPVVSPLTQAAIFLVLTISPGGEDAVRDLIPDLSGLGRSVGFRIPEAELQVVVAIGSAAWDRLFDGPRPRELHPFRELESARHKAPATPGDLLFHIRASRMDLCFEYAAQVMKRLGGAVEVADEVQGFRYFDERDLIGFVDGTESPGGAAGVGAAITSADDDPDFAGGSYVIVQKYLHDMAGWNSISIEEQERVIGRTKLDDIELPDEIKPANSHVALNTITGPGGEERQIVRANMPFGNPGRGEFGTYYIAYAATPSVTEEMLTNMFIGKPPGNTDRILDFSTALTGCLFFAPCADFLDDPPGAPGAAAADDTGAGGTAADAGAPGAAEAPGDGSLGIGSLRGL
ncbi:MAG TPA: Dyp-type peroxidase [Trebonia sp.]|nr:Dyp-type peroxidase [Trebonia sp.]